MAKKLRQPSKADVFRYFLWDLFYDLKEDALETKKAIKNAKSKEDKTFHQGRRLAYWEVLTTIKNRLVGFQIPFKEVKFGINPDRGIMGLRIRPKKSK